MQGTILIVDNLSTNRILLRVTLAAAYYDVVQAASGQDAIALLNDTPVDLIILSAALTDMSIDDFCTSLKARKNHSEIPTIVIAPTTSRDIRLSALRSGAQEVLHKPVDSSHLRSTIRCLLRQGNLASDLPLRDGASQAFGMAEPEALLTPLSNVMIAAARSIHAQTLKKHLCATFTHRITCHDIATFLRDLPITQTTDALVLMFDATLTETDLRLLSELRSNPRLRNAAILVVLPTNDIQSATAAHDLGANAVMLHGPDPVEMGLRLTALLHLKHAQDRLRMTIQNGLRAALIDPLTGLYNRRFALAHLQKIVETAHQSLQKTAFIVADLDHFKHINDRFGHATGDKVLIEVSKRLCDRLRTSDLIARIGGEEFLIALPNTSLPTARRIAQRLCESVGAHPFSTHDGTATLDVTISMGVAMVSPNWGDTKDIIDNALGAADKALYEAKSLGRNRIFVDKNKAA